MPEHGQSEDGLIRRLVDERNHAENDRDRYRAALERIARLQARWEAPDYCGSVYDDRAWAALGSEAHAIARRALAGRRDDD